MWADASSRSESADAHLLNLLVVRRCDILVTDRISGVVIDGEHHVELEQVHELNKQARYRKQAEWTPLARVSNLNECEPPRCKAAVDGHNSAGMSSIDISRARAK